MNPKTKDLIWHYLYGAFAAVWNGIFSTVYVSFGGAAANAAGLVDLHDITWKGLLSTLGGTIVFHAVSYFYNHPIPKELPDGTSKPETLTSVITASQAPKSPTP